MQKKRPQADSDFRSAGLTPHLPVAIFIILVCAWLGYLVYFNYESIWLPYGRETYAVVELALKSLEIMKQGLAWRLVMLASFLGSSPKRVGDFGLISDRVEHAGENF